MSSLYRQSRAPCRAVTCVVPAGARATQAGGRLICLRMSGRRAARLGLKVTANSTTPTSSIETVPRSDCAIRRPCGLGTTRRLHLFGHPGMRAARAAVRTPLRRMNTSVFGSCSAWLANTRRAMKHVPRSMPVTAWTTRAATATSGGLRRFPVETLRSGDRSLRQAQPTASDPYRNPRRRMRRYTPASLLYDSRCREGSQTSQPGPGDPEKG